MEIAVTEKLPSTAKVIKFTSNKNDKKYDILVESFLDILTASCALQQTKEKTLVLDLSSVSSHFKKGLLNRAIQGLYTFDRYKTSFVKVRKVFIYDPKVPTKNLNTLISKLCLANEVRDIANEPSNIGTPDFFCKKALSVFESLPEVLVTVFDEHDIKRMGLGLVHGVGKGSVNPPRFLVMDYNPKGALGCICLVGKGVTMDTGGISLKPREVIHTMHMDDTGAAIVVGMVKHFASVKAKQRIVGVCPLVENAVSGDAQKPGDIITAFNQKTVEVVDTDAEGRLILADAISYSCANFKPDHIIDFATLTSWSSRIHCHTSYTYFTLDEHVSNNINKIGEEIAERSIRIPPWTEYTDLVKSEVADIKNFGYSGCKNTDGFMAVMFLLTFVPPQYMKRWIHFDIKHISNNPRLGLAEGFLSGIELVERIISPR